MELEGFFLFKDHEGVVGISAPRAIKTQEEILVTDQGVHFYNITQQKSTFSWTGKPSSSSRFTQPAVSVSLDRKKSCFAVRDDKYLWSWQRQLQNVELDATKHKCDKKITGLRYHNLLGENVVLVFEDASVRIVDAAFQTAAESSHKAKITNLWSSLVPLEKEQKLFLFNLNKKAEVYSLQVLEITATAAGYAMKSLCEVKLTKPADNAQARLLSCAVDFHEPSGNWVFSVIWSTCNLHVYRLRPALQEIEEHVVVPLASFSPGKDQRIECVALPNAVGICGKNSDGNFLFSVWDTNFGTFQRSQLLEGSKDLQLLQVCSSANNSFVSIAFTTAVFICFVYVPAINLANALGKMVAATTRQPVVPIDIMESLRRVFKGNEGFSQQRDMSIVGQYVDKQKLHLNNLLNSISDPKATAQQACELLFEYLKLDNDEQDSELSWWEQNQIDDGFSLRKRTLNGRQFGSVVAQRCVQQKYWQGLEKILRLGIVSVSEVPSLLPELFEHNQIKSLFYLVKFVPDLSPSDLVAVLKYIISADHRQLLKYVRSGQRDINNEQDALGEFFFYSLSLQMPPLILQRELTRLGSKDILVLFDYLQRTFIKNCGQTPQSSTKLFHFKRVISWLNLILDSHFSEIVLVRECHATILELKKLSNVQIEIYENLQGIHGYLDYFSALPPVQNRKEADPYYSIEVLKIHI